MTDNLYEETLKKLEEEGLSFDGIMFISMDGYRMTVDTFKELAARTNYDSGYGEQEINSSLTIWGMNWVMYRCEYDGSEWWEVRKLPRDTCPFFPKHLYESFSFRAEKGGEQS